MSKQSITSLQALWVTASSDQEPEAYLKAFVTGQRSDGSLRCTTQGRSPGERICRLHVDAWPRIADSASMGEEPSDLTELPLLHKPALLNCLRRRLEQDHAFGTWLGRDSLLWLNPCGPTPELWTAKRMRIAAAAAEADDGSPPDAHCYSLGERALRAALGRSGTGAAAGKETLARSQAVLVHGEQGAGQPEVFVLLASYWLWRTTDPYGRAAGVLAGGAGGSGSSKLVSSKLGGSGNGGDAAALLAAGEAVLQAFGSARSRQFASTPRFGRCLRLRLDAQNGSTVSITVSAFGLEASRVCEAASEAEGNFHAYYAVLHQASLRHGAPLATDAERKPMTAGSRSVCAPPRDFAMLRSCAAAADGARRGRKTLSACAMRSGRRRSA